VSGDEKRSENGGIGNIGSVMAAAASASYRSSAAAKTGRRRANYGPSKRQRRKRRMQAKNNIGENHGARYRATALGVKSVNQATSVNLACTSA
jgi:hypothetical protein